MRDKRHSDVASTHQYLAQNFNEPAPITLLRFCNLCTKLWKVRKSQLGLALQLKSGFSQQICTMAVCALHGCSGPLYFSNLSWFPVSDYINNIKYTDDRKFIEVYVCQKLLYIDEALTKLLQK